MKVFPDQNIIAAGWQPSTPSLISFGHYQFNEITAMFTSVLTSATTLMASSYMNEFSP
jgi:hypothetical protein